MSRVLIVDDEDGIRDILRDILQDEQYTVFSAADGIEGLDVLRHHPIDVVLLDVWLPRMGGIDVLKEIKANYTDTEVVIISGHGNIDLAVKAVKLGAFDFLEKPLSLEKVLTVVKNALQIETLKKENRRLRNSMVHEDEILGETPPMQKVRTLIGQSAGSDSRILILGDNGTGKELVAREIHRKSRRAAGPFVEVNCAAIPDALIESELFGHEKGAFTGAVSRRKGKFELADGGTLFLDEIADMSLSAQAKVLRAVQEMTFERIGGEDSITVDVRVIAATNKDIQAEIKAGRFREDLFFRLNVIPIQMPALRERAADLPLLLAYFMEKFRPSADVPVKRFADDAMAFLTEFSWPGNVRELKNFAERINIMSDEEVVSLETVRYYLGEVTGDSGYEPSGIDEFLDMGLSEARENFERRFLVRKLAENENNISRTAQDMGIYPSNLHAKIKKYGIEIER
ncbi:MAG: sigma-54-dependent Fis family transcriptional regulator [Spirochaetaceae bacterium]|nr:MAG: sigma-54-dependent Fis family transcriptional regulator [Spirochaetaceae bacterium]